MRDSIKDFVFEVLPEGSGKWIVVAWGKVVNELTGSYEQEIVLKRYSENDEPSKTWDLRDHSKLTFCKVNLGSLRVLSPGTIIQNQRIFKFVHEYLVKREITIEDPQALLKKPFRILYDPTFPDWERLQLISSIDKLETRLLDSVHSKILFPCNVIADYYYYGMTYLIKAIMEGRLSTKLKKDNDVYHPGSLPHGTSPNGQRVVRIQLQRRMHYNDRYKIARLAFDDFFRSKCLDIYTGILKGNIHESYVDTDFPVQGPITLSVYGTEVGNLREKFFLVHSISKCSSKPPFDFVIAAKDFKGESYFDDKESGSGENGDTDDTSLGLAPKGNNGKKRSKTKLNKGGKEKIGGDEPHWNSDPENIPFDRDQADNFPDDAAINEKDFVDPKKKEQTEAMLKSLGYAAGLTTNPNKKGSDYTLRLGLFANGPTKPKPAPPTTAFERIENLVTQLEVSFKERGFQVASKICCPVNEGIDKYSAFPVTELMQSLIKEVKAERRRACLNFCFMNVREKYHTQHRRIYINEMIINGHVFYFLDVEPKYKVENEKKELEKFITSFGVILYNQRYTLSDAALKEILERIVTTSKTSVQWNFLNGQFLCFQHRADGRAFGHISKFILRLVQ